jgi:bla regulator protein blaR1
MKCGVAPFVLAAGLLSAQTQAKFEVASIKPSNSADRRLLFNVQPGGRLTVANFTLKKLIQQAYDIKDFQISGGPGGFPNWIGSDQFDITAKAEDSTDYKQLRLMLQSLLADRFQLVMRRDTKEMPTYALVLDKNGPKFKESAAESQSGMMRIRRGVVVNQGVGISQLAEELSNFLGRAVVDKTGLAGKYDVKLEWQPDENQIAMFQNMGVPEGFGAPAPDANGPSLFAALQEQLGLKLESQKGPVEIFVIEHVERPSEN